MEPSVKMIRLKDNMPDNVINFVNLIGHWGYLVIFLIVMLECQAILGLFMPGESLVLIAGFLAQQGIFEPTVLAFVIAAAAILGDSIGYELGRRLGLGWLVQSWRRFGLRQESLDRVDRFFARHGGKAVFASHFMHMMRALMPFIAGASRMRYRQFLVFNAAGCIVWATAFVALGYFLGASWQVAAKWIGRASEIIGGAILLAIVLGWLWHWMVRHEADVMQRWQSAVEHPRVAALRRRFAPQLQFFRDRLSPEGYLGLQMTIGLLCFIGASWLFGGIAEDVLHGDPLTVIDKDVALWLHERTTPGMRALMQIITDLASSVWVTVVSSLIVFVLCWKRYWYRLLAFMLVYPGGMVLTFLLKIAFHRSRPSFADSVTIFQSYGFPSGHTMAAMLLYGMLAVLGVIAFDSWRWRVRIVISACITVLLVGFSRMYLSAHYLSDVLAAIAVGFAWLALCLTAVNTLRRYRTHRDTRE
jgi:membrane protein DedA with SNARE-associated domain/membrane-associated phospholipid phosphatase